jgi:hypothetical protein
MRTPRRITTVRLVCFLLGLGVAAGLFALGRGTAADHRAGAYRAGYARGLMIGRAEGVQEGRADQETGALPPATRAGARAAFDDGYRAGANDVFGGYDGGWSYATPYVITLARGGPGVTYRFASRTPLRPGVDYYLCPHSPGLCLNPRG